MLSTHLHFIGLLLLSVGQTLSLMTLRQSNFSGIWEHWTKCFNIVTGLCVLDEIRFVREESAFFLIIEREKCHCAVESEAEETVDHGSYNTIWHEEKPVLR